MFRKRTLLLFLAGGALAQPSGPDPEREPSDYPSMVKAAATVRPQELPEVFERTVALRRRLDGLDETRARIAVHRDIAAAAAARESWMNAVAHTDSALQLARSLADPDLVIGVYLQKAGYHSQAGDKAQSLGALDAADAMIRPLGRHADSVTSSLLRAGLLAPGFDTWPQADTIYESLLADPKVDHYRVELERARHTRRDRDLPLEERWNAVLLAARVRADRMVEAEAHDRLGDIAQSRKNHAIAAGHFAAAEETGAPLRRKIGLWLTVIAAYSAVDDRPRAQRALAAAAALVNEDRQPGPAADLHEARGDLLGREGEFTAAFRELQRANELRRRRDATRQIMPFTRIVPTVSRRETENAAELATVRAALREAELERSRLRERQTAGMATVAALTAVLLGLAYAYKRRSATALASARDNAELRADRIHWQMLRYQLNPHFLFNALSSLGGLVATDPRAAGRVVERLSEFCQLALKGSNEDLRTLGRELEIIRAYLDVELAGAGDTLTVRLDAEPSALPCLVPPLLLLPLVENALKYGGETSPEQLTVELTARRNADGASLEIEVANTGHWIGRASESRQREAVGLANVRERIARFGGGSADLTFQHDGHWVRARLRLPARAAPPAVPAP